MLHNPQHNAHMKQVCICAYETFCKNVHNPGILPMDLMHTKKPSYHWATSVDAPLPFYMVLACQIENCTSPSASWCLTFCAGHAAPPAQAMTSPAWAQGLNLDFPDAQAWFRSWYSSWKPQAPSWELETGCSGKVCLSKSSESKCSEHTVTARYSGYNWLCLLPMPCLQPASVMRSGYIRVITRIGKFRPYNCSCTQQSLQQLVSK
jgi:hypothetical protein